MFASPTVGDPMTNPLTGYSTATNVRHAFYIVVGIAAVLLTWPYAFDWMSAGGNILNPITFFGDGIEPGGTAAFLSFDMLIAWAVFTVWVVTDTMRIGMGLKSGVLFVALSYIGVSMAFPFYLVARERFLIRNADQPTAPTVRAST
jgi:hypothetical protein